MSALGLALAIGALTLLPAEDTAARMRFTWRTTPIEFLANVLLFVPLFAAVSGFVSGWRRPLALALSATLLIETLQLFVPGRQASPLDVAANVGGAALGIWLARRWSLWAHAPSHRAGVVLAVVAAAAVGLVALDAAGARYAPTASQPYVQITPRLSWLAHSTWNATDVRLRDVAVRRGPLRAEFAEIAKAPCAGGRISTRLRAASRTSSGWAPLIRVADEYGETLTVLAEWNGALLLTGRTVARSWGAPYAWHVIRPRVRPGDTVDVLITCDGSLLRWQTATSTERASGAVDVRFGHLIRALTSSLLAARDARVLHWPVTIVWCVFGAITGWALPIAVRGARPAALRITLVALALLPGVVAWMVARADARVAAFAWSASFLVLHFVARARPHPLSSAWRPFS